MHTQASRCSSAARQYLQGLKLNISPARPATARRQRVWRRNAEPEKTEVVLQERDTASSTASAEVSTVVDHPQPEQTSPDVDLELKYVEPSAADKFWTSFKLAFARPWRRFKKDSVLAIKIEGEIPDQSKGFFSPGTSIPQLTSALQKAALDPRVAGLAIEVGPLAVGYAKLQEIRRYISYFRDSGKFTVAFIKQGGEKEYYLASACQEIYAPPSASISLRGFSVGGTFLRGVLDKVGVEPQVERIGAYKSAGDQLLRREMSAEQREQLQALLDETYSDWVATVAAARGKPEQEVKELLDAGTFEVPLLAEAGWLDGLKYEDELIDDLKKRTGVPEDKPEKPLRRVTARKVASVCPTAYGLAGGRKRIVVLRTAGAILGKAAGSSTASITPDALIPRLRALAKDKSVAAVVLRVDSPGGDALASDLMWREVKKLAEKKPVIASMGDVAASGGYYISMAANKIVAEKLTVTGSIGVVTGKFNLSELYEKVGYAKELISRGRYAELFADNRPFTPEEKEKFEAAAQYAYQSFRDKAAASRGMEVGDMQQYAQGRVWSGRDALARGLVDALGGVHAAVQLAKHAAGIKPDEKVRVVEVGRAATSPLALLRGGAAAAMAAALSPPASGGVASLPALLGLMLTPLLTESTAMGASSVGLLGARAATTAAAASIAHTGLMAGSSVSAAGSTAEAVLGAATAAAVSDVALALGPTAASAAAAALALGGAASPFGISLAADAECLAVTAAGSAAALAQAGGGAAGAWGAGLHGLAGWEEDSFLAE